MIIIYILLIWLHRCFNRCVL